MSMPMDLGGLANRGHRPKSRLPLTRFAEMARGKFRIQDVRAGPVRVLVQLAVHSAAAIALSDRRAERGVILRLASD